MNVVFRHMKFGSIHLLINNWIPNYKTFFYISYIPIRKNASLLWSFTLLEIYDFLIYEKILMFSFFWLVFFFIESESCSLVSDSLQPRGLYSPWNSPGHNTGVGSLSLLRGIIPTQGSNPGLLLCKQVLYQLSHKGSPRIPEWIAYPFSSRSSRARNPTGISCIAGRFFTNWAIRETINKSIYRHI